MTMRESCKALCRTLYVAIAVLALQPHVALGQEVDLAPAVRTLKAGDELRLEVLDMGRIEGRFVVANATTLTLASPDSALVVPLQSIEQLWVRGRATGKGALIGAGVGADAGIVYGLLISTVACEPVDGGDCTALEVAAVTGLLGGAGGAALGAGVGFTIPVWKLRFP